MKKVLTVIAVLLLSLHMQGQDNGMLSRIKAVNGKIKSFEANLNNTMIKPKKTTSHDGMLYFVSPNEFAALFVDDTYMIVNEKKIKIDIGMFHGTFRLRNGGVIQSLSHTRHL